MFIHYLSMLDGGWVPILYRLCPVFPFAFLARNQSLINKGQTICTSLTSICAFICFSFRGINLLLEFALIKHPWVMNLHFPSRWWSKSTRLRCFSLLSFGLFSFAAIISFYSHSTQGKKRDSTLAHQHLDSELFDLSIALTPTHKQPQLQVIKTMAILRNTICRDP